MEMRAVKRILCFITLILNPVKGKLDWNVYKKITRFGQELILFCKVENCCSKSAGWNQENQPIFLNVATLKYNDTNKYDGRLGQDGFFLFIRNFSTKDIDREYSCSYGFQASTRNALKESMIFQVNIPTTCPWTNEKDGYTIVVIIVLPIMSLFILVLALFNVPMIRSKICESTINGSKKDLESNPGNLKKDEHAHNIQYVDLNDLHDMESNTTGSLKSKTITMPIDEHDEPEENTGHDPNEFPKENHPGRMHIENKRMPKEHGDLKEYTGHEREEIAKPYKKRSLSYLNENIPESETVTLQASGQGQREEHPGNKCSCQ